MAYPQESYLQTTFASPSFIQKRRDVVFENTLLYQLNVLKETGRYNAFELKWHPTYNEPPDVWPIPNHLFWDSDIAKWIEGACYFLAERHNDQIDFAVKELVEMIGKAQQSDGYLNIHFTVVAPKDRFTNLRDLHELYNAGHLIEAALAHNRLYRNELLLAPICKYADLLCDTFGPGATQKHGYPGHPEIELTLLRLSQRKSVARYGLLGKYFLEERGNPVGQDGKHYYDVESEKRGESERVIPDYYPAARSYWYNQAHLPIIEQPTIEGHSVRAMYLLTALADQIRLDKSTGIKPQEVALKRLWSNMVDKKMSVTGGIGAQKKWEGFGIDYFLPQGTDEGGCYNETCAAIGVMMLAERLLQIDLDGKYADIMELCFLNAVMTGMSSCGTKFTYVNQLASSDDDLAKRKDWFTCACCPPNVTRLLGYMGGYLWTSKSDPENRTLDINVHMYSSATLRVPVGDTTIELEQTSNWPWEGKVHFHLSSVQEISIAVKLRIPHWAEKWEITPPLESAALSKGYLTLPSSYLDANPKFELNIDLKPRLIVPHPFTNQNTVTLARGPIIYCLEDIDNPWVDDHFKSLCIDPEAQISETWITTGELGEPYVALTMKDCASFLEVEGDTTAPAFHTEYVSRDEVKQLNFTPYALRDNRGGKGHMRVGLRRRQIEPLSKKRP